VKKYHLILILFLLPCLAFTQTKKSIDSFMDIPLGSDSVTVKAAILAKGGAQNIALSKKDLLVFDNFSLSRRPVRELVVKFVNNKAFDAFFYFLYSDTEILDSYDNLVSDIAAVYGKPAAADNYTQFSKSAVRIRKIRAQDIIMQTVWLSKNKNAISVKIQPIDQFLMLMLTYEDGTLFAVDAAKKRSDL
jgi:hypothetical protein